MSFPFHDLSYLRSGSAGQRRACRVLRALGLPDELQPYAPRLVGTFPLDLQRPGSDLDVVCEVHDFGPFEALLVARYCTSRRRLMQIFRQKKGRAASRECRG